MDHIQITDGQHRAMLDAIGVPSVDHLFAALPERFRLQGPLDIPAARSELDLCRALGRLGARNRPAGGHDRACFLGGGAYDHFIPAVVDALASQGAFVTAYTPYQAEASQGALQAFFEFQTQVCRLSAMDVANASLYERASAVAEAVLMALNVTGRRRVLASATLHPHDLQVLRTYLEDLPVQLIELAAPSGRMEVRTVADAIDGDTACVVVASPNVYGLLEDWSTLFSTAHQQEGTLAIAVFNPIACALHKRPGDCGADVAVAEGQPLGIPLQYGGPYLGLFAASQRLMRKIPGRVVGQTTDRRGRRGFCLTLQTREQHIRRAKATSNVCTNQGLLALRASIYMSALGPRGLREVALACYHKAHHAADRISALPGYRRAHEGAFFHEFVVECPVPAARIIDLGRARGIAPGLDCARLGIGSDHQLLVAVTEKRDAAQINALVALLADAARSACPGV